MTRFLLLATLFLASFAAVEYKIIGNDADEIDRLNVQITSLQHDTDACRAELNAEMMKTKN